MILKYSHNFPDSLLDQITKSKIVQIIRNLSHRIVMSDHYFKNCILQLDHTHNYITYFLQTHNSDHDLVAPIVQHSFDEHESGIKENVTEPNSQEQELKVCLVINFTCIIICAYVCRF